MRGKGPRPFTSQGIERLGQGDGTKSTGGSMFSIKRFFPALLLFLMAQSAIGQQQQTRQGLQPYTPTRIEWLALVLQSQLRQDFTPDSPFALNVINTDHETILIFVRYQPHVDREILNMTVDTAREVAQITTKSYGWSSWVKIKERVEMVKRRSDSEKK